MLWTDTVEHIANNKRQEEKRTETLNIVQGYWKKNFIFIFSFLAMLYHLLSMHEINKLEVIDIIYEFLCRYDF